MWMHKVLRAVQMFCILGAIGSCSAGSYYEKNNYIYLGFCLLFFIFFLGYALSDDDVEKVTMNTTLQYHGLMQFAAFCMNCSIHYPFSKHEIEKYFIIFNEEVEGADDEDIKNGFEKVIKLSALYAVDLDTALEMFFEEAR